MKKRTISGLLLAIVFFAISCSENRPHTANYTYSESDTSAYEMVSFYKSSTDCESDTCGGYLKATYPKFQSIELQSFVNQIITNDIENKKHQNIEALADSFLNDYDDFKKEYPDAAGGYEWIQELKVNQETPHLLLFTHTSYNYTGGAHGLQTTVYYNYAKTENKALKLEEIIKPNQYSNLVKVGEEIFRQNEKLPPAQSLGENYFFENGTFSLNDNFLITDKGLLFTYNPYEIKAYAYGTTDLLIPYEKIKNMINPKGVLADYMK